jgi:hypothetical protein
MLPLSLILVGCGGDEPVEFPDLLVPLEPTNLAPWPEALGKDHPQALELLSGNDPEADRYWAHGRGYIHGDLETVWAAARTIEVNVDRREVESWSVTFDTVDGYDASYTIHNTVADVITVNYDTTWVHQQQGDLDEPVRVVAVWDKTDGTTFIDLLAGSLVLKPVTDDVTSIELIEHLRASLRDEETLEVYLTDLFDELVAETAGEPLPDYP